MSKSMDYRKAPFPWFGGKADAAPLVWRALGNVDSYIEPFAGSLAVLLRRPHILREDQVETVGDIDALVCNFWRAVQFKPQETAEAASWPVSELDKHARGCAVLKWRESEAAAHLAGDPYYCDPLIAGWWVWLTCVTIGTYNEGGPWWPDENGYLRKIKRDTQDGIYACTPYISHAGRGVNHQYTREIGITADRPSISDAGRGVNAPYLRERGAARTEICAEGNSEAEQRIARDYKETGGFHPITMPTLRRWFAFLQARLRHVRILNADWKGTLGGSWKRVVTKSVRETLSMRLNNSGVCGIFFDPPYAVDDRDELYSIYDSRTVAQEVRQWCLQHGEERNLRIVYAGFDVEGAELVAAGWREVKWFRAGALKGGMAKTRKRPRNETGITHQQYRERLWLSPHCLKDGEYLLFD